MFFIATFSQAPPSASKRAHLTPLSDFIRKTNSLIGCCTSWNVLYGRNLTGFGTIASPFEAIPVKRDEKDVSAIKKSLKDLKEGKCIALFPEGTRNGLEKGEKVKDGVAFFAIRSGAKVVPCGIKGGTKGHHKITITYGKTLDYSEYKGSKDKEVMDKVTKEIMDNIIALTK